MDGRDDDLFRRLTSDTDSDWPDRLLHDLSQAPLVDEKSVWLPTSVLRRERPSPREVDCLRCLSHGMTEEMAADALGIGMQTVVSHLKHARYILKAKNTMHACCIAIRQGLIN